MNTLETGYTFNSGTSIGGVHFGITYTVVNYGLVGDRVQFITLEDETGDMVNLEGKEVHQFMKAHGIGEVR